jgi:para-nitrobenzyl esterase
MRRLAACLLLSGLVLATPLAAQPGPEAAQVDSGALQGVLEGDVAVFRGIPYAAPPVGALRWRAPQPVAAWSGTRVATSFGNACLQPLRPLEPPLRAAISEDCLYLNVWRPARARRPLPVMVWIHGGSLVTGAASIATYDGANFARRGVVLVSINYRLGHLGYFGHPALTRAGADGGRLANYGLMDQVAALEWVRRNVAAFGGDPRRVTIFGQSAGALSVELLMASPEARGLFQRAIVQSGYWRGPFRRIASRAPDGRKSAEEDGVAALRAIGIHHADAAALRRLTEAQLQALPPLGPNGGIPALDGRYVVEDLWTTWRAGRQAPVPLLAGATGQETPPLTPEVRAQFRAVLAPFIAPPDEARLLPAYGGQSALDDHLSADFTFAATMYSLANLHLAQGHPAWRYRFATLPADAARTLQGLPHSGELPYVFGTLEASRWKMAPRDRAVSAAAMDYWVEFARSGVPAPNGRPAWPQAGDDRIMLFDDAGARPEADERAARYRAMAEIVDPKS